MSGDSAGPDLQDGLLTWMTVNAACHQRHSCGCLQHPMHIVSSDVLGSLQQDS